MSYSDTELSFEKFQPGADIVFMPDDITDYRDDAWDIRISLGDSPLEEAFYFTVEDSSAVNMTIEELLDNYALNPALKSKLDIAEYPELPFLQDELILYRKNAGEGLLTLEYYINHDTQPGPTNLQRRASDCLSVCTYHDGSHDYRVLDLVFLPCIPQLSESEIAQKQQDFGPYFLLLMLERYLDEDNLIAPLLLKQEPMVAYLENSPGSPYPQFIHGMMKIESSKAIERVSQDGLSLKLTDEGLTGIDYLKTHAREIASEYNQYDSVSIAPPALGVPEGFDVRVQMMEYDGLDYEREVVLQVILENQDELFDREDCFDIYENFAFYEIVAGALAYKTNFSKEILEGLKALGTQDS